MMELAVSTGVDKRKHCRLLCCGSAYCAQITRIGPGRPSRRAGGCRYVVTKGNIAHRE
jgi:hypothetical protein